MRPKARSAPVVAGLAAFLLLLLTPASAGAEAVRGEAFLAGSLTSLRSGAVAISFRGNQQEGDPRYGSSAKLLRTPCPGRYEYLLETEAWPAEASTLAVATVVLSAPDGALRACGEALPQRPGQLRTTIGGPDDDSLVLVGERFGTGSFDGAVELGVEPWCNRTYSFELEADLAGWHRDLSYRMNVQRVRYAIQGRPEPRLGCSDSGA
jgi:hypothetical protein